MSALDVFSSAEFGEIRWGLNDDQEPWFVAADVARALGYRDAANMARRLDDDEKGTRSVSTPGGPQRLTVITEPGLYTAILGSQRPSDETRRFKRWVTHDVIPQIRRTGTYGTATVAIPADYPSALEEAARQARRAIAAETRAAELEPAAAAWHGLADDGADLSVRAAAQTLHRAGITTGQNRLFRWLRDNGWIDGRNEPYQRMVDAGLLARKVGRRNDGQPTVTPRVTLKGLERLRTELAAGQGALVLVGAVS